MDRIHTFVRMVWDFSSMACSSSSLKISHIVHMHIFPLLHHLTCGPHATWSLGTDVHYTYSALLPSYSVVAGPPSSPPPHDDREEDTNRWRRKEMKETISVPISRLHRIPPNPRLYSLILSAAPPEIPNYSLRWWSRCPHAVLAPKVKLLRLQVRFGGGRMKFSV